MKLMTRELENRFNEVGDQDEKGLEATVIARFFCPWSDWTWYATEFEPETGTCFGLVSGFEVELGYFNLQELGDVRGPGGLTIERDFYWQEKSLREVKDQAEARKQCGAI